MVIMEGEKSMIKKLILGLGILAFSSAAYADSTIRIVGSSTVYPFATVVAEKFGKSTTFKTPIIESTGSGGGFKLFCQGKELDTPSITNASRAIKKSEIELCKKNGVTDIKEVIIGYDGIVIINKKDAPKVDFSTRNLFLALAKNIMVLENKKLVPNNVTTWSKLDKNYPEYKIEILGPPPTSGTRDAFLELAMEKGAKTFPELKALRKIDKKNFKALAHGIREDGAYVEAGENDNLIVQKLTHNPKAFGITGFSFLDNNLDKIQGAKINGVEPTFENISNGTYPLSRPLFFYVKEQHISKIPGIAEYVKEFTSPRAIGEEGYLLDKGLIPVPK